MTVTLEYIKIASTIQEHHFNDKHYPTENLLLTFKNFTTKPSQATNYMHLDVGCSCNVYKHNSS